MSTPGPHQRKVVESPSGKWQKDRSKPEELAQRNCPERQVLAQWNLNQGVWGLVRQRVLAARPYGAVCPVARGRACWPRSDLWGSLLTLNCR